MKTVTVILETPVFAVRHCERKRSNPSIRNERMDCFVACAPRNDDRRNNSRLIDANASAMIEL
jgi:hypothetical protein